MALATSSAAAQMEQTARQKQLEFSRMAQEAHQAAQATRDDLPRGIDDLTPAPHGEQQLRPRLRARIVRYIPGLSGA
ncbi:MAG: hypothetical protein ACJ789_08860 [Thermomicrobiales bacterium]